MAAGHDSMPLASIPSPSTNVLQLGPLTLRLYGLMLLSGIIVAVWLTRRRWRAQGGNDELVYRVALWGVLAGIVGARLYHDLTSWNQDPAIGGNWYGPIAVWKGGLGIWGGVLFGALAGAWVVRRAGESVFAFMDAVAPGLLLAQGIGRIGNYFNQELFGKPTSLPWGLRIDPGDRPDRYANYATFHPTFLYELLWDVGFALFLIWLGRRFRIRAPGLFALYVGGYSFARIFEELLRVDPANYFLGLRLNFFVAMTLTVLASGFFCYWQFRRQPRCDPRAAPLLERG